MALEAKISILGAIMPDINKMLGIRIRKLRTERKLTQEELAEQADISMKYLGEIERGRGNPTLKNIEGVASVLGMEASELLNFGELDRPDQELRDEIIARLKKADSATLRLLYMALRA
ncbi:helix-turn-helix domain-containing protein [Deltaproteobacteria bacterium OttesenSCG-928-M10]|nr:helix-turn-helix domain-containing protein [Deltaproteobacteria bacterium OttesenSCG-928-M10]